MQIENTYDQEQWKQHPVYALYEVSDMGRVRNRKTHRVLRAAYPPGRPYCIVNLAHHNPDGRVSVAVHRLVAETWLGMKPTRQYQCRHLNGNPCDNSLVNLTWGTTAENRADQVLHGRVHIKGRNGQPVTITAQLIKDVRALAEHMDGFWVSAFYNVPEEWVSRVATGKAWAAVQ